MTNQEQTNEFPVYFGLNWGDDPLPRPCDSIHAVTQVIRAMNDLLLNYRDPNDLGENSSGDVRMGISFVFEACSMQLEAAAEAIELQKNNHDEVADNSYPRLGEGNKPTEEQREPLSWSLWQSPAQWAAMFLADFPTTTQGVQCMAERQNWRGNSDHARKRQGRGGGWEYHISALPPEAQAEFHALDAKRRIYDHKITG